MPKVAAEDEPRYRKKSQKKPPRKADHKHTFVPCVFEYEGITLSREYGFQPEPKVKIGSYCPECGKIGPSPYEEWMEWVPMRAGSSVGRIEWSERVKVELNPATRTLPTFRIGDIYRQKFV